MDNKPACMLLCAASQVGLQDGPKVQIAAQQPSTSKTAKEPSLPSRKGRKFALASKTKPPGSKVEAAIAMASRPAEGNMAEEDDFFMQSGDEEAATGEARDAVQQVPYHRLILIFSK